MPRLSNPRHEAFADGVASGLPASVAYLEAGFRCGRNAVRLAADEKVSERIVELQNHLAWGGSRDLGVVIDEMMLNAKAAANLGSAAGMMAAKALLVEAARHKEKLPLDAPGAGRARRDPLLTDAQWEKLFGPGAS